MGAKSLSLFNEVFFVSGVNVLRMREGHLGIRLFVANMRKQDGMGNLKGKRRVWGWVVEAIRGD